MLLIDLKKSIDYYENNDRHGKIKITERVKQPDQSQAYTRLRRALVEGIERKSGDADLRYAQFGEDLRQFALEAKSLYATGDMKEANLTMNKLLNILSAFIDCELLIQADKEDDPKITDEEILSSYK